MPSLTLPDRLIWFAHCPKAGGTSVERFMVDCWGDAVGHLHWGWDLWWKRGGWRHANPPNSPQHLIWEDALKTLPRTPDIVFAVVRDPLSRLVSEYHYQRQARRGTRIGRGLAHLPFSTWARVMVKLAASNPYAFDNHLRPQGDFIPDTAHVFRLEDGLAPVADWLLDEAGHPPGAQVSHSLANKSKSPVGLCREDVRFIQKYYETDYRRFGYSPPDPLDFPERRFASCGEGLARMLCPPVKFLERCGRL